MTKPERDGPLEESDPDVLGPLHHRNKITCPHLRLLPYPHPVLGGCELPTGKLGVRGTEEPPGHRDLEKPRWLLMLELAKLAEWVGHELDTS